MGLVLASGELGWPLFCRTFFRRAAAALQWSLMVQFWSAVGDDQRRIFGFEPTFWRIGWGGFGRGAEIVLSSARLPLGRKSGKFLKFNRLHHLDKVLPESPASGRSWLSSDR
jgi:hypothetical protein